MLDIVPEISPLNSVQRSFSPHLSILLKLCYCFLSNILQDVTSVKLHHVSIICTNTKKLVEVSSET